MAPRWTVLAKSSLKIDIVAPVGILTRLLGPLIWHTTAVMGFINVTLSS